jgi:hypothetical protein
MTDHLVIGDPHAKHSDKLSVGNRRFDALGKYILEHKPSTIVCMGDFADMESLSSYDKGKKSFEGRRFLLDVEAAVDAQQRMLGPLQAYNADRRRMKEKQYKPRLVMLGGNHDEERIHRAIDLQPELEGLISLDQLKFTDFGWEYVPYKQPAIIDGIAYCHHFPGTNSHWPIGGLNVGKKLLTANHTSSTVGHNHHLDIHTQIRADGTRMWGISAGCFREDFPTYARDNSKQWWRGILHKFNVLDGDFDLQTVSLRSLIVNY